MRAGSAGQGRAGRGGAYDASMGLDDFPRVPLLFGPSPVHPLPRLSAALGGGVEIWAKREDCNSGIAFGGNKVRKLEYLVAEALAQGCDTLVSIGGVQSNHTRQVTGVACHLGLKAVTVQEHWVDWPDPIYDVVGNVQLTRIMGGDVRLDDAGFDIGVRDSWKAALESVIAAGGTAVPDPRRRLRPSARRTRLRQLGAGGGRPGGRARRVLRPRRRVHGHRLDARRHDRRVRARGPRRPPRHRHRCVEDAGADGRPGHPHRQRHRRQDRRRTGPLRPTRSPSSTGTPARATASPTSRRSRRSTSPPGPRACSPTRSTRASRWPG